MSDHLETLREYQRWRRGGEGPMLHPVEIGKAIDATISEIVALRTEQAKKWPGSEINGPKVLQGG